MPNVLIVDDDVELLEGLRALFEGQGYAVSTAVNGTEGLQRARDDAPDAVLLDVMMANDSEGFEVARTLHEDPRTARIPVILLTGVRKAKSLPFSFEPDEDWLPVVAVLEKPVRPELLLEKVGDVIKAAKGK
jgi:CheY-like chemotaxis protein